MAIKFHSCFETFLVDSLNEKVIFLDTHRLQEEVLDVVDAVDKVGTEQDGRDDCVRHKGPVSQVLHVQTVVALKTVPLNMKGVITNYAGWGVGRQTPTPWIRISITIFESRILFFVDLEDLE